MGGMFFSKEELELIHPNVEAGDFDSIISIIGQHHPDIVVNCIGIIKQLPSSKNSLKAISINSLFPHRLAYLCCPANCRLVHISTDCVFNGKKGRYLETDVSDAEDLYGKTKFLGEIHDQSHVITIRTSIIGHELSSNVSLVDWFLSQTGEVYGYTHAMYSGFPTIELTTILREYVFPHPELHGLYHVSSDPISKFDLLSLIGSRYGKSLKIRPTDEPKIDRSLLSNRFREVVGYYAPSWSEMIKRMHNHFFGERCYDEKRQLFALQG